MAKQINLFGERKKLDPDLEARKKIYNSRRWRKLRLIMLGKYPICQCGEIDAKTGEVCSLAAEQVHHILDLSERPDLAYTMSNLQSLNTACHTRITSLRANQSR